MSQMPADRYRKETRKILKRVILYRLRSLGIFSIFKTSRAKNSRIIYVDAGLHKEARELNLVISWLSHLPNVEYIGFEAHPLYFAEALRNTGPISNTIHIVNQALVGPDEGSSVQLHLDGGEGLGDSLLRKSSSHSITVPAVRLSHYLRDRGIDPSRDILILRMNIEGAEILVLRDLRNAGMMKKIDGFFGSWDDIRKIGGKALNDYKKIVRNHRITHLGFNNRDLRSRVRRFSIRYHMNTCIMLAMKKKQVF